MTGPSAKHGNGVASIPIDYASYARELADGFVGRHSVLRAISEWLRDPNGSRVFMITGEPGSGKSAIMARLVQLSTDAGSTVTGYVHGFLSAVHFCRYTDYRWTDPVVFAESISTQLANRYPEFERALVQSRGDGRSDAPITINVTQQVGSTSAPIIGSVVNIHGLTGQDAFGQAVREPLEAMLREPGCAISLPVVIAVDALDEAWRQGGSDIVSLLARASSLPAAVRLLLTCRPNPAVLRQFDDYGPIQYDLSIAEVEVSRDIKEYAVSAARRFSLTEKLHPELTVGDLGRTAARKSEGNFLYVRQLIAMLREERDLITTELLERLPDGLDAMYLRLLDRLTGHDRSMWSGRYEPILGALTVVQSGLTEEELADISGIDRPQVRRAISGTRQLLELPQGEPRHTRYAFFHRSFADFLLDDARSEEYWLRAGPQHARVGEYFLTRYGGNWLSAPDHALLAVRGHLEQAIRLLQMPAEEPIRSGLSAALARLNHDRSYQQARRLVDDIRSAVGQHRALAITAGWYSHADDTILLVVGQPGSGKTMLAKRTTRLVATARSPFDSVSELGGEMTVALVESRGLDPFGLIERISASLASGNKDFRIAVQEILGKPTTMTSSSANNPKFDFQPSFFAGASVEDALHVLLREPLLRIAAQQRGTRFLLVIDGIDEAADMAGLVHLIGDLREASEDIRLVVTSRMFSDIQPLLPVAMVIDLNADAETTREDVVRYVAERLASHAYITAMERADLAQRIAYRADGNILMARLLVDILSAGLTPNLRQFDLPMNLADMYAAVLHRLVGRAPEWWHQVYQPLLGVLAVARGEGLTEAQVTAITHLDATLEQALSELGPLVRTEAGRMRLFHASFLDYLLHDGRDSFHIDPAAANSIIARYFAESWKDLWLECTEDYALSYTAAHYLEALGPDTTVSEVVGFLVGSDYLLAKATRLGRKSAEADIEAYRTAQIIDEPLAVRLIANLPGRVAD